MKLLLYLYLQSDIHMHKYKYIRPCMFIISSCGLPLWNEEKQPVLRKTILKREKGTRLLQSMEKQSSQVKILHLPMWRRRYFQISSGMGFSYIPHWTHCLWQGTAHWKQGEEKERMSSHSSTGKWDTKYFIYISSWEPTPGSTEAMLWALPSSYSTREASHPSHH